MGRKKRNVLPLSLQSSAELGDAFLISVPTTVSVSLFLVIFAPSASRQFAVDITSSQSDTPLITLVPSAIAAQMSILCAIDFDAGAVTLPFGALLCIFTFIIFSFEWRKDLILF
jgi:hypothetical protein